VQLDACVALADLVEQGLIEIRRSVAAPTSSLFAPPTAAASQTAAAQPSEAETRSRSGFLERLLADAQAEEQRRPDLTDDDTQDRKRVSRYVDDRR
jgi:hypothetical protein